MTPKARGPVAARCRHDETCLSSAADGGRAAAAFNRQFDRSPALGARGPVTDARRWIGRPHGNLRPRAAATAVAIEPNSTGLAARAGDGRWKARGHCAAAIDWIACRSYTASRENSRRAVSSAVEHCFHTAGVTGSSPVPPTKSIACVDTGQRPATIPRGSRRAPKAGPGLRDRLETASAAPDVATASPPPDGAGDMRRSLGTFRGRRSGPASERPGTNYASRRPCTVFSL